jgi:hypothetical protein
MKAGGRAVGYTDTMEQSFRTQIVHLNSSVVRRDCPVCQKNIRYEPDWFGAMTTHLVDEHGGTLKHVGQETSLDKDGRPHQATAAVIVLIIPL